jgi:GNAT superfamily N-acetyltransferase
LRAKTKNCGASHGIKTLNNIMSEFIYRELNFQNVDEVAWAAKNYCENPRYWENEWNVESLALEKVVVRINAARADPKQKLFIVELNETKKIAFHWIKVEESEPGSARYIGFPVNKDETICAHVIHLWVHDDFWGRGIANVLKQHAELWAKQKGATRIQTSVHTKNKRMFDLNLRAGFEAGNIVMSKNL